MDENTRLVEGQEAPDFVINDVSNAPVELQKYKGSITLISFFRYAGCPFCNLTLIQLIKRYDNFAKRGLKVITFFQSPDDSIDHYVIDKRPPFPIVADPDKTVYSKYRVESSGFGAFKTIVRAPVIVGAMIKGDVVQGKMDGDLALMPAQFIIGPDLKIIKAHYGNDYGDKISFIEIEEILLKASMA